MVKLRWSSKGSSHPVFITHRQVPCKVAGCSWSAEQDTELRQSQEDRLRTKTDGKDMPRLAQLPTPRDQ